MITRDSFLQISKEKKQSITEVTEEAKAIIDEMAHNMSLTTLRFMAFLLRKILSTLYKKVLVNGAGIERVKDICCSVVKIVVLTE